MVNRFTGSNKSRARNTLLPYVADVVGERKNALEEMDHNESDHKEHGTAPPKSDINKLYAPRNKTGRSLTGYKIRLVAN